MTRNGGQETHTGSSEGASESSPFAQLLGKFPEAPAPPADKAAPSKPVFSFHVGRTRKGGYPITLEKRPGGKTMTIIRNVSGDADALLTLLKKRCAAGGKAFDDWVEVQGDHCDKVQTLLKEMGL
jgi:translation initiation factor 1 (eIF-1/SUI1)